MRSAKFINRFSFLLIAASMAAFGLNARADLTADMACGQGPIGRVHFSGTQILNALNSLAVPERNARTAIRNTIGACVISPPVIPTKKPSTLKTAQFTKSNTNMYDAFARGNALTFWNRIASSANQVSVRENGNARKLTREDYVAIDAFARTLFSEARGCPQKPYLEAAARTILNRASGSNTREFQKYDGPATSPITRTILSDYAYSAWNNDDEVPSRSLDNHRKNTSRALCPLAEPTNPAENLAWQKSVDIAMHAILDRDSFLKETNSLDGALYFTSGISRGSSYIAIKNPTIYGQRLDDPKCMRFWKVKE